MANYGIGVGSKPRRLALLALVGFLMGFALYGVTTFIHGSPDNGFAGDWRVFYSVGETARHGGDPYNVPGLQTVEQATLHRSAAASWGDAYSNTPLLAGALEVATLAPFWRSFLLLTGLSTGLMVVTLRWWLRRSGWDSRTGWVLILVALIAWPTVWGFSLGQLDALLFSGLTLTCVLTLARKPGWAGLSMLTLFLKPHLFWPVPLVLFLYHCKEGGARKFALGTLTAGVLGLGIGEVALPGSTVRFLSSLRAFGGSIATQPDLVGISGYFRSYPWTIALAGVGASAVLLVAIALSRTSNREGGVLVGVPLVLAVWLTFGPYAHTNDLVLVYPLLIWLLRPMNRPWPSWREALLVGMAVLPPLYGLRALPFSLNSLEVSTLAIGAGVALFSHQNSASIKNLPSPHVGEPQHTLDTACGPTLESPPAVPVGRSRHR